jgi:hypothetical protein
MTGHSGDGRVRVCPNQNGRNSPLINTTLSNTQSPKITNTLGSWRIARHSGFTFKWYNS